MTRTQLLVCWLLIGVTPGLARGEDAPPCAAEADAVKKMKKRDPSLRYPDDADAKEHLEAGKRAFGVQRYDQAIEEYTAAGLADDAPLILYNLGQTYRAAKDYERAIRQYRLFLERGAPGKEVRALVECQVKTMTAEMEHAASTAPPTGPAPDQTQASPDPAVPLTVAPEQDPEVSSEPSEEPYAEIATSRWTTTRQVAVGVAAGGVVALATSLVFGIQVQGLKSDASDLCPSNPCGNADEANVLSERADTRALYSNISLGVGASMLVGAAVLWYVGAPSQPRRTTSAVAPQISPTFAGIAFRTRF